MFVHIIVATANSLIGLSIAIISYFWFREKTFSPKWFKFSGVLLGLAWFIVYGLVAIFWRGYNPPIYYSLYIIRPLITITLGCVAMGIISRYRIKG